METTRLSLWLRALCLAAPLSIAGCSGSMGGSTMPPVPPGPQGAQSSGIQPAAAPASRQVIGSIAVAIPSAAPQLQGTGPDGFGLVVDLTKPSPEPASPKPSATAGGQREGDGQAVADAEPDAVTLTQPEPDR